MHYCLGQPRINSINSLMEQKMAFAKTPRHTSTKINDFVADVISTIIGILAVVSFICFASYDQIQDEQKTAEVISNTTHIASLDAADQRRAQTAALNSHSRGVAP